jgi:hypothetical protein
MKVVSLLGVVVFMLTSLVVGTRVIALWWRTRKLPELLLGIALLLVGFVCYAVGTAGKLVADPRSDRLQPVHSRVRRRPRELKRCPFPCGCTEASSASPAPAGRC